MPRRPLAPYREILSGARTGDLVFFRGLWTDSRIIQKVTGSTWSHVSMIVDPRETPVQHGGDELLLWESTDMPGDDINPDIGVKRSGPMLTRLSERMRQYMATGKYKLFSIRYLHVDRTPEMLQEIATLIDNPAVRNGVFPTEMSMICDMIFHRYFGTIQEGTFFCSELVATTYQAAGLLPSKPHPQSYVPLDFADAGFLPLLKRAEHGRECYMGDVESAAGVVTRLS